MIQRGQIEEDVELPHLRCPGGNEGAEGSDGESRSQHSQQIRPETSTDIQSPVTNVKCPLFGLTDAPAKLIKATGLFLPYCGEGETSTFDQITQAVEFN